MSIGIDAPMRRTVLAVLLAAGLPWHQPAVCRTAFGKGACGAPLGLGDVAGSIRINPKAPILMAPRMENRT